MADAPPADPKGLEAFRRYVVADAALVARLRPILERDEFLRAVDEVAEEGGFRFEPAEVAAAMREGQMAWLTHWLPTV